ncbi:MAG: M15 family metallopeptidase [Blastocatellia bacterium]
MRTIYLLPACLLFTVVSPALAANAKKDTYVPVRKGKKGKLVVVEKEATKPVPRVNPRLAGLHPQTQVKVKAALKDMDRIGVCPAITSAYRSNAEQQEMYRCAHRRRCRAARGIYSARKPGTSLHEAGLAVDFADIAHGQKNRRALTRDGRKIVKVMEKHGFKWRYGLKDPAHFELDPRAAGYKSEQSAIIAAQKREAEQRLRAQKVVTKAKARRRRA